MDALLVIDMQEALFRTPRYDSDAVVANINRIAGAVRDNGGHVIYVRHNGTEDEGLTAQSDGWAILAALDVRASDTLVDKTTCDAFYGTALSETLARLAPDRLIVTGCATDFCVDTTIRAAVSRDFRVVVVADGHTTTDRPHLDAQAIITHHNWMWANLIAPGVPVTVTTTAELLADLDRQTH
jgi:nicotinamidase-related amidase